MLTAAAAAATAACATSVSRESFPCVQDHLVWLRHEDGERRVSCKRRVNVVVVLLLRGDLATSAPECPGPHHTYDRLDSPKICGKSTAVAATKLGQRDWATPRKMRDVIICRPLSKRCRCSSVLYWLVLNSAADDVCLGRFERYRLSCCCCCWWWWW